MCQAFFRTEKLSVGINLYHCLFCKYTSRYLTNVRRHVLIHTGQKPYQCEICGLKFRQKEHLKGHVFMKHNVKFGL
ncbi:Zinc finger and BTB domain-containing protein 8B, partial [Stegodyphus mimosarum]